MIAKPLSRSGFMSAIMDLQQDITDPPPFTAKPIDFVAAQPLLDDWSARRRLGARRPGRSGRQ